LLYEIGFSSEQKIDGEVVPNSFEFAQELLDNRIKLILEEVEADEPPLLFLTTTKRINKMLNKERKRVSEPPKEYVENFRVEAAKEKEYKGGRKADKPFHFYNLLSYILGSYPTHVNEDALEADDAMCIYQYSRWKQGLKDTIICSRDKDLRQCPGFHYSWEVGKQAAIGPIDVDELGWLEKKSSSKVFGVGDKFFYYQMIAGDNVDNIGGIKGKGPMFAYHLINEATSSRECYELVAEKYVQAWGEDWKEKMKEQARLLYMIRELDEEGNRIEWKPPKREVKPEQVT
jgi:hypothetical protein